MLYPNNDKIHTKCKKKCNHEYIITTPSALVIDSFTNNNAGYVNKWLLKTPYGMEEGTTIEELVALFDKIKNELKLEVRSEYNKDTIIIYTDELAKCYGFLHNYYPNIEAFSSYYFTFDNFEIRDITEFFTIKIDDIYAKINYILEHAEVLYENIFFNDKYFYITPVQKIRKDIKKNFNDDNFELFPENTLEYNNLYQSYIGGFCICNYPKLDVKRYNTIEVDRKSAYIYDLLIEKHICEPLHKENKDYFDYYFENSDDYYIQALLKIRISGAKRGYELFKDVYGDNLEPNKETYIRINNIDLKVLMKLCKCVDYECVSMDIAKKDYLPRYIAEIIEREYIKKVELERTKPNSPELRLQKIIVNGIYGSTVKKIQKDFITEKNNAFLSPYWGVLTTSYARNNLISLAIELINWLYTDTDSIYCKECEENYKIIKNYNKNISKKVYNYCMKNNLNYDIFCELGKFVKKGVFKRFKANGKKQYMHTDIFGNFELVASGITKKYGEEAYELNELERGSVKVGYITEDVTECEIDGIKYYSNGSYFEKDEDFNTKLRLKIYLASHIFKSRKKV